ncbi:MAG: hypothetical protein ACTHNU_01985 [Gaiellales bacterium]
MHSELHGVLQWFAQNGTPLEIRRHRDGSYRALFSVGDHMRMFGMGATPLAAALSARSIFISRFRSAVPSNEPNEA